MARKTQPRLPLVDCSGDGCSNQLRQTKRSYSGLHFCKEPACQAEKQRRYSALRRAEQKHGNTTELEAVRDDMIALLRAAIWGDRRQCPECGLMNALPGWPHPTTWGQPCYEMGERRPGAQVASIFAVWPDGTRKYADA